MTKHVTKLRKFIQNVYLGLSSIRTNLQYRYRYISVSNRLLTMHIEVISQLLDLNSESISTNRHWKIIGCSAMSGLGVDEGIRWIVDDVASRVFVMS